MEVQTNPDLKSKVHSNNALGTFEVLLSDSKSGLPYNFELTNLKRGKVLWRKGEQAYFCGVIVQGLVEICDINPNGALRTFGIFGPGDVIGLSALIKDCAYPASAIAATPLCQVYRVHFPTVNSLSENLSPRLNSWIQNALLRHEDILRDKLKLLGTDPLQSRLLAFFEHMHRRFAIFSDDTQGAQSPSPNHMIIPHVLTKTQIARIVEARVETVIRTLNRWEKTGGLIMCNDRMEIHKPKVLNKCADFKDL